MRSSRKSRSMRRTRRCARTGCFCSPGCARRCTKSLTSRRSKGDNCRASPGWPVVAGHDRLGFPFAPGGSMKKGVYAFGGGKADGSAEMKNLLGGKGANLAEMSNLGLPVPPGFTITTDVCTHYYANGESYPGDLKAAVESALAHVGSQGGGKLGDPARPLLVSVRSGARVSMPGMMD